MYEISYVIVSTPRSATGYLSKVFNNLGLNCTHEGKFNPWKAHTLDVEKSTFGDSSWMAVPYLFMLPRNTTIIHQIRNPLATLNSNLKPSLVPRSMFTNWERRPEEPYAQFVWDHTTEWTWANDEKARIMQFWCGWHKWIEWAVAKRSDLRYIRFKIEELDGDKLHAIVSEACPNCWGGGGPGFKSAIRAMAPVPNNFNHHGQVGSEFSMEDLTPAVKKLAVDYGYEEYLDR